MALIANTSNKCNSMNLYLVGNQKPKNVLNLTKSCSQGAKRSREKLSVNRLRLASFSMGNDCRHHKFHFSISFFPRRKVFTVESIIA